MANTKLPTDLVEVYKQRYETFRHLDKLRWQMIQIAAPTVAGILAIGVQQSLTGLWWIWATIGSVLTVLGVSMDRINRGIVRNNIPLAEAAKSVGDSGSFSHTNRFRSVASWIGWMMIAFGIVFFVKSAILFWRCLNV